MHVVIMLRCTSVPAACRLTPAVLSPFRLPLRFFSPSCPTFVSFWGQWTRAVFVHRKQVPQVPPVPLNPAQKPGSWFQYLVRTENELQFQSGLVRSSPDSLHLLRWSSASFKIISDGCLPPPAAGNCYSVLGTRYSVLGTENYIRYLLKRRHTTYFRHTNTYISFTVHVLYCTPHPTRTSTVYINLALPLS